MKRIIVIVCLASVFYGFAFQAHALDAQQKDAATDQAKGSAGAQPAKTSTSAAKVEQAVHCDVEAKCLAKLPDIANRFGKNLILKLDNGSTKSFLSTDCNVVETCEQTSLVEYRPSQRWFVLSAGYYESFGSILVSRRTGEVFRIGYDAPHFSPDGKRFVVVAVSEQDGENQVSIYSTSSFPPLLEWKHFPKSWDTMYKFDGWNGNDQIKLRTLEQNSEANVSRTASGWTLAPPDGGRSTPAPGQ